MIVMVSTRIALLASLALCAPLLGGCGWKLETQPGAEDGASAQARRPAPPFSLANDDGTFVSLDDLVAGGKPTILVFYRGHW